MIVTKYNNTLLFYYLTVKMSSKAQIDILHLTATRDNIVKIKKEGIINELELCVIV